jgi:filamentous hemagglutinin family protein
MKSSYLTIGLAATLSLTSQFSLSAMAQITTDGSLSTRVTIANPNNFVINEGDRAGSNLFHSFGEFSVPTGGSVFFNNAADVQNIFSRVTGGNLSNIDGLIRANGGANLFLLNPSGILLGANARLDIGGSFIGTTAQSIQFADGFKFSASSSTVIPLLTISAPVGLQMGQNPASITVQNSGHRLSSGQNGLVSLGATPTGLSVDSGRTLALVGGSLVLNGGIINATSGHIELGSVSSGTVNLDLSTGQFDYANIQQFGDIQMSNQALVNVSGSPAGSIHFQGQTVELAGGSTALSMNQGNNQAGNLKIDATESFEMWNGGSASRSASSLLSSNLGAGQGGDIFVSAPRMRLLEGGRIQSQTSGTGIGGAITVTAVDSIELIGFSPTNSSLSSGLTASTSAAGRSGDIQISTGRLMAQDGGGISTTVFGTGAGGNITVTASDSIELRGENPSSLTFSAILAGTTRSGNAGQLIVNTPRLRVLDGAIVGSTTAASGNSGNVRINASDSIQVSGVGVRSGVPSQLVNNAQSPQPEIQRILGLPALPTGSIGSLSINTARLRVTNQGSVGVEHQGVGNAGELRLNADRITLDRRGHITASTRSGGGGNINLNTNALTLRRGGYVSAAAGESGNGGEITIAANRLNLLSNSRITTLAQGTGNAGTLRLQVGEFSLNNGQIEVDSQGSGNAGRLIIEANSVELENRSLINASTQTGLGGDVQLQVRNTLQLNDQSRILANAAQAGQGGNVNIIAAETLLQNRSQISTNARGSAVGGALRLEGDRLSLSNGSQITALTTGSGIAGSLNLSMNNIVELEGQNTRLSAESTTNAAAGSVQVRSPQVTLSDRARISVSGQGAGGAGNLLVDADLINLRDRAGLEAEVAGGDRGNITLNANLLSLRQGSRITTNATGAASGGNINLNSDFILGFENSDIVAQAQQGTGGNIAINTQGLIAIAPRPELTSDSDINASSQLGLNGTVNVQTPNFNPESGLIELPTEVADASQQIAQTCSTNQVSRFVSTGRGGIPSSPFQSIESDRPWSDLRDLSTPEFQGFSQAMEIEIQPTNDILEAIGWRRNAAGQVELFPSAQAALPQTATCKA